MHLSLDRITEGMAQEIPVVSDTPKSIVKEFYLLVP